MSGKIYFKCLGDECLAQHVTHFGISDQAVVCLDCGTRFVPDDVILAPLIEKVEAALKVNVQGYAQLGLFND